MHPLDADIVDDVASGIDGVGLYVERDRDVTLNGGANIEFGDGHMIKIFRSPSGGFVGIYDGRPFFKSYGCTEEIIAVDAAELDSERQAVNLLVGQTGIVETDGKRRGESVAAEHIAERCERHILCRGKVFGPVCRIGRRQTEGVDAVVVVVADGEIGIIDAVIGQLLAVVRGDGHAGACCEPVGLHRIIEPEIDAGIGDRNVGAVLSEDVWQVGKTHVPL